MKKYKENSPTLKHINDYRKDQLRKLLSQCTSEQQAFFDRMYVSIDVIPDEKIDWAIKQCERTIVKTEQKIKEKIAEHGIANEGEPATIGGQYE